MKELHGILFTVKVFSNQGENTLKDIVTELKRHLDIVSISSIYQVVGSINSSGGLHDIRSIESFTGLTVAIKAMTDQSPVQLVQLFSKAEVGFKSQVLRRSVSINLLIYEGLTMMTPQLTLPHPDFHTQPESLVPAAEIWGDLQHPILKQSLTLLTRRLPEEGWGEFYAQGKTLLDF